VQRHHTSASAFDPDTLGPTQREFHQALTLPGACFRDQAVFELERTALFASGWHIVARAEDLASVGSFRRVDVCGESVLLVRSEQGVGAWYNVCLHRGSRLLDAQQGLLAQGQIRCPYHAWCYALDGRLTHVPRGVANSELGLKPVRLAEWGGYLLVNLDQQAPSLAQTWSDLPDLSAYRMPSLRRAHRESYQVAANWKLIGENYSECYHCPGAHPQLSRISDYIEDHDACGVEAGICFNGGPMRLREGFSTMSMTGQERLAPSPALAERDRRIVLYYLVYPNIFISPHPDYVLMHWLTPLAPDRTRVDCEWLVAPESLSDREAISDIVEFWHLTNRQDWALCERNHDGVISRAFQPGAYHESETCVHAFDRWYATWLEQAWRRAHAG
jgi:Rieske 2Fe-2S family protein